MQAAKKYTQIVFSGMCVLAALTSCRRNQSFETAIAKHRNSLVDQVNSVGKDLPYYTVETLNPVWNVTAATPIVSVPKIKLVNQNGDEVDETIFDGKLTVVGFMFASCRGFCPFLIDSMKSIEREVKDNVQFVAITVDPETDTPAQLKKFAKARGIDEPHWMLLTGDKATIYSLAKKTFASQAFKKPTKDVNYVHSEHLYVIDGKRNLRGILNGTRIDVKNDARTIISQLKVNRLPAL